ncbi:50S ribosomal protein L10 [Acinetobacter vivianii]
MALLIEDKKQIVAEVNEVASKAFSAVVADYQGLTVEQLTTLRVEARKLGVTTRIVRNTLAKRSFEGTQFDILNDDLVGPTILGFSTSEDDMGAAARLFEEFAKLTKHLNLKLLHLMAKFIKVLTLALLRTFRTKRKRLLCLPLFFKLLFRNWVALLQRSKRKTSQKRLNPIFTPFNIHLELFSWL